MDETADFAGIFSSSSSEPLLWMAWVGIWIAFDLSDIFVTFSRLTFLPTLDFFFEKSAKGWTLAESIDNKKQWKYNV